MRNKRGMELAEIGKILIAVLVLALMVGIIIVFVQGRGGEVLDAIKNMLRMGGK